MRNSGEHVTFASFQAIGNRDYTNFRPPARAIEIVWALSTSILDSKVTCSRISVPTPNPFIRFIVFEDSSLCVFA
jgi:hypothetical protein